MDGCTAPEQPNPPRETKGKGGPPLESGKIKDPNEANEQPRWASCRQTTESQDVHHYPEANASMTSVRNHRPSPLASGLGNMASTLPNYLPDPTRFNQPTVQHRQFVPVPSNPSLMYGMPQLSLPEAPTNPNMIYNAPYPQTYIPYARQQHHGSPVPYGSALGSAPGQMDAFGQSYFHPNMYAITQEHQPRGAHLPPAPSLPRSHSHSSTPKAHEGREKESSRRIMIVDGSTHMRPEAGQGPPVESTSRTPKSATFKVPPRKPKQSGNALWVGNLAPGTNIVELKNHFSQDATKDLESVFLISRSNCAFVNYKTEAACLRALSRFHDTRLRGARLVCRERHRLMSPGAHSDYTGLADSPSMREADEIPKANPSKDEGREGSYSTRVPNRYFILKSLTVEDLGISWQSGIWATQTRNEESLNRAFENADNVYLIFSANKSGEYYGYARMMSTINDDESLTLELPPRPDHDPSSEPDGPDVTPTPASSSAPSGRIINDVARGTIFWEADTSEDEEGSSQLPTPEGHDQQEQPPTSELQLIGKPFRIRWLSTERVPFHRTRGLRNPWNANREVKIARDGTELEPSVGEKLVLLFHPESSDKL
ncbi:putative YT521-B-like splicing factor [Aspergillus lucknowensis]|uniref:YT521-B-like domain-containing protein n=1 Tax=Aspergillus lucknowensis TaxID=176173 RepID=A0ABR4LQH3_9EURO